MSTNCPDSMETTIQTFRHHETGSVVDLVGMIHIAEPQYYERIQHELDQRDADGYLTHYELVRKGSDAFPRPGTLARVGLAKMGSKIGSALFGGLGLVKQIEHIDLKDHWENHDITIEQYLGARSIRRLALGAALSYPASFLIGRLSDETRVDILEDALESIEEKILGQRDKNRPIRDAEVREIREIAGLSGDSLTLNFRNTIAIDAIDAALADNPEQNITAMWGEAHLIGLAGKLAKRGFFQADEQRITAITYENMREHSRAADRGDAPEEIAHFIRYELSAIANTGLPPGVSTD